MNNTPNRPAQGGQGGPGGPGMMPGRPGMGGRRGPMTVEKPKNMKKTIGRLLAYIGKSKILLFVMVNGWTLLIQGLVRGYV